MCGSSCTVDKRLLPIKISYFFTLAGVASLLPYLTVYMKQVGLSAGETALIHGAMPFLGAIVSPLVGALADKLHAHKVVFSMCCILSGVGHGCLMLVPPVIDPAAVAAAAMRPLSTLTIQCEADSSTIQYCADTQTPTGVDCRVPATALFNLSATAQDPFFRNASDCTLQCDLSLVQEEDSGLCFANMMGANQQDPICDGQLLASENLNGSVKPEIEFIMEEMNHSLTRYHFLPDSGQSTVCHYYTMSAFLYNGSAYRKLYCAKPTPLDCEVQCARFSERAIHTDCEPQAKEPERYGDTFWIFFGVCMAAKFAFASIFSLLDALAYDFLGEERGKWGRQRLWGTIGFACAAIISGLVMDNLQFLSKRDDIDYTPSFIAHAVLGGLTAIVVCPFKVTAQISTSQVCRHIGSVCRSLEVLSLFFVVLIFGMLTGVIETFLFWHLQTLGASQLLMGLCMFMNCLPEVPILFLSGRIIQKIGEIRCLYITAFAYAVRFLAYSFLLNPWMVLGIEPLHGITFGLMYAAATSYGSVLTPAGLHGTMQGLITGIHFGFGKGLGSVVGGYAFERYGAVTLFRACSVASVILVVVYAMLHLCFSLRADKSTPSSSKADDDDEFEEKDPPEAEKMLSSHVHRNHHHHKPRHNNYKDTPVPIEVAPPSLPHTPATSDNKATTLNTFRGYNTHPPPVYATGAEVPLMNTHGSLGRESARESAV